MLAPARLSERFAVWNRRHGAPFGFHRNPMLRKFSADNDWERLMGPFCFQPNNTTRIFEYPWVYHTLNLSQPSNIAEIGGSLSGLQFVLSGQRHTVVNIDPGIGWSSSEADMTRLNSLFKTNVRLIKSTMSAASVAAASLDHCYSISVLEHLSLESATEVMDGVRLCLKSGGLFVLTIDLFLNLKPFTTKIENKFGINQSIKELIERSGLELVSGVKSELYGFPEFDPDHILSNLQNYFIGEYPTLIQCVVLRKN